MRSQLKKLILSVSFALSFGFMFAQGNSGNDDVLIAKAKGAAAECLKDYRSPMYEIFGSVEITGICFVEGFITRVTLYAGPNCNNGRPCGDFPTRPVAYVDFLCGSTGGIVTCL